MATWGQETNACCGGALLVGANDVTRMSAVTA